ncbi:2-succinyl-6-hydroxy-2,4-cyclohexadiene-1-carboxylate synthase [compost metagenome]
MKRNKILLSTLLACGVMTQTVPVQAATISALSKESKPSVSCIKPVYNYERKYEKVQGEYLSYIQLGEKHFSKSIVIIHGSAFNADAMIPYGELYAKKGYNVILVDLPGHFGNKSVAKDEFNKLGDSIASLMTKLVAQGKLSNKSEVQGWSLGGSVALDLGMRYEKLVKSVGMIDAASNYYGVELPAVTGETRVPTLSYIVGALKSPIVDQASNDALVGKLAGLLAPTGAINNDFAIDKVLNIDSGLKKVKVPVNIFYGAEDTLTTLDKQKDMISQLKKGKLHVEKGYGHLAILENPQIVFNAFEKMNKDK